MSSHRFLQPQCILFFRYHHDVFMLLMSIKLLPDFSIWGLWLACQTMSQCKWNNIHNWQVISKISNSSTNIIKYNLKFGAQNYWFIFIENEKLLLSPYVIKNSNKKIKGYVSCPIHPNLLHVFLFRVSSTLVSRSAAIKLCVITENFHSAKFFPVRSKFSKSEGRYSEKTDQILSSFSFILASNLSCGRVLNFQYQRVTLVGETLIQLCR